MYHLRFKGEHYDMGVKRGNIFKKLKIIFPLKMDEFQLKHGIESEKILKQEFSEVCEEVKGITDTLDIDYDKFMSWMLAMGCCMYNLDKNIPIEVRGCTAFGVIYKDKVFYGRNNDLPPYLKKGSKSEIYNPINGNKFNITTSSFINGEEGMNDKGLVVGMTFVNTRFEDIRSGLNSVFVVRLLLEKAKNVEEAEKILMNVKVASNFNIILIDKEKNMEVVECNPKIKNIRKPIQINDNLKVLCTTNCFTSNEMNKYEFNGLETYNAIDRYNTVINAFKEYNDENIIDYIKDILMGKKGFICQYDKSLNFETIWSSIFDLNKLDIYRCEDDPRKNKFILDKRLY